MIKSTLKNQSYFDKTLEWYPGPPMASKFEVIFLIVYPMPKLCTVKKLLKNDVKQKSMF